ncbi:MAG TPA: GreA/GreB family elongation factor [Longimicrobiales bacterium]
MQVSHADDQRTAVGAIMGGQQVYRESYAEYSANLDIEELRERVGELLNRFSAQLMGRLGDSNTSAQEPDAITRQLQVCVARLGQIAAGLAIVDVDSLPRTRAGFASKVIVKNIETGQVSEHMLMTGSLVDVAANQVSLASPMGQALLGAMVGEEIRVDTPQGRRGFRVIRVKTLADLLATNELLAGRS